MNKNDIILAVSKKSGVDANTCEKFIDAFEKYIGIQKLQEMIMTNKQDKSYIINTIVEKTDIGNEDCVKIADAFEEIIRSAVAQKLNPFSKKKK